MYVSHTFESFLLLLTAVARGQQQCYYGVGAQYRGPPSLVPCNNTGTSACCLLGSDCLSGSACWDPATGTAYQYGCTDITYTDKTCPYKCGFDPDRSPWTALQWCADVPPVDNTWICHGPESCGCEWENATASMLILAPRGCSAMGSDALVALSAPGTLPPYVSLPNTLGGSTGYFSTMTVSGTLTWMSTAVPGYTPTSFTQFATYTRIPRTKVWVNEDATADASTYASARRWTGSGPTPTDGNTIATSPPTTTTTPALPTSFTHNSSEPLSQGAKIGLGVGIGLAIPIVLLLSLMALYSIRKQTRTKPGPLFVQPSTPQDIPSPRPARPQHIPQQYWGYYQGQQVHQQQQQVSPVYEPKESQSPSELPGDRERVEVR